MGSIDCQVDRICNIVFKFLIIIMKGYYNCDQRFKYNIVNFINLIISIIYFKDVLFLVIVKIILNEN